jgi:hypothetical protein
MRLDLNQPETWFLYDTYPTARQIMDNNDMIEIGNVDIDEMLSALSELKKDQGLIIGKLIPETVTVKGRPGRKGRVIDYPTGRDVKKYGDVLYLRDPETRRPRVPLKKTIKSGLSIFHYTQQAYQEADPERRYTGVARRIPETNDVVLDTTLGRIEGFEWYHFLTHYSPEIVRYVTEQELGVVSDRGDDMLVAVPSRTRPEKAHKVRVCKMPIYRKDWPRTRAQCSCEEAEEASMIERWVNQKIMGCAHSYTALKAAEDYRAATDEPVLQSVLLYPTKPLVNLADRLRMKVIAHDAGYNRLSKIEQELVLNAYITASVRQDGLEKSFVVAYPRYNPISITTQPFTF